MATKKYVKDVQKEGKFGHYMTGTGGGEPIPAGKKMSTEKRDPDQPRSSDGKFTYNSVNGKPLKDISKSHGHSRGTTIPPTLTGGKNGIHYYSDSTHEHIVKGGQDALEKFTSLTVADAYRKGDRIVTFDGKIAIAKKDFIESATEYVANKKKEGELSGALKEAAEARKADDKEALKSAIDKILESGHFEGDPTSSWERKEAETPEEKRAVASAELADTKGKELVERKREEEFAAAPKYKKFAGWAKSYVAPSAPRVSEEEAPRALASNATASLSDEQIKSFGEKIGVDITRGMLEEAFADPESGLSSAEDVLKAIGEGESAIEDVKPAKAEEPKEEVSSTEEVKEEVEEVTDEGTEEELLEVIKDIDEDKLIEAVRGDEDTLKEILPFAKKKFGESDKSDIDLVIDFIKSAKGTSKEDAMKEFGLRGE